MDAAKHQDASQFGSYINKLPADSLVFGEVIAGAGEGVQTEMYTPYSYVTEFDWAQDVGSNIKAATNMQ
jgi:hypothetical protein